MLISIVSQKLNDHLNALMSCELPEKLSDVLHFMTCQKLLTELNY